MQSRTKIIFGGACVLSALLASCVFLETPPASISTPLPISNATPAASQASRQFWAALHGDNFATLPSVIAALQAADHSTPNDPTLTMLLGMSYAWLNFEQNRSDAPRSDPTYPSLLAQSLDQATTLLAHAQQLAPYDRIVPGFVAAAQFVQARAASNSSAEDAAYQFLLANTKAYPQFQGFVQGWVLTAMYPVSSPRYNDGFDGYFKTLDTCIGFSVSKEDPNAPGFVYNILSKADPACYNTNIAPHNLEGTFLGLGDAYAKQGKLQQARDAYVNIQHVPSYKTWKFQNVVEARIAQLDQLQAKFTADSGQSRIAATLTMFFQATYSCAACHAQ